MTRDPTSGTRQEEQANTESRLSALETAVALLTTELAQAQELLRETKARNTFLLHKQIDLEFELFALDRRINGEMKTPTER